MKLTRKLELMRKTEIKNNPHKKNRQVIPDLRNIC